MERYFQAFLTFFTAFVSSTCTSCIDEMFRADRALETEVEEHFRQMEKKKQRGKGVVPSLRGAIGKKARKEGSRAAKAGMKKAQKKKKIEAEKGQDVQLSGSTASQSVGPVMTKILARKKVWHEKKRMLDEDLLVGGLARVKLTGARQKPLGWAVHSRPIRKVTVAYGCGPRRSTRRPNQ